ncbi:hypothetical protein OPV22_023239 [Ensete ventricosum]|uniref:RNase H type-1 domain-containing protein n=1 Tax=Ensete ventricosum TaxID=4639 RepID=A0AAV8QUZ8_ENSVE|nr:hypothetical protein OPV22_023239 [Ensete ventricosum]
MANAYVKRVMIDTRSSADILYFDAFQRLGLTDLDLAPLTSTLTGFTGDSVSPLGATTIPVTFGGEPRSKTPLVSFMVVKLPSAYNAIIGLPTLNRLRAVVSTYHRILKFPTRTRVGEVRSDPRESRQCYLTALTLFKKPRTEPVGTMPLDPEESTRDPHSTEKVLELPLDPSRPDKLVKVGSGLTESQQVQLIDFLRKNNDVFAWSPSDMSGDDPEITQHYLNISPDVRPVKQQPRKFAPDRQKAIEDEVARLLDAKLVEEIKHPTWLSNVVLVKKANGKWRISSKKFYVVGRRLKWSIELREFDIEYEPRKVIKGQVLADFLSELTPPEIPTNPNPGWTLHIDGSANSERGGVGLVLKNPSGHTYENVQRLGFKATNNEAEYEALLFIMKIAAELGAEDLEIFTDS